MERSPTHRAVIIQGSARSFGHTRRVVDFVRQSASFDFIDLRAYAIGYFDYEFKQDDDFGTLIRQIVDGYDVLVFASPVYWYSMSGRMKVFFDRITDLLKTDKDMARRLRGKGMAMISCGSDADRPEAFRYPFVESAAYLGMHYLGDVHAWIDASDEIPHDVGLQLTDFAKMCRDWDSSAINQL